MTTTKIPAPAKAERLREMAEYHGSRNRYYAELLQAATDLADGSATPLKVGERLWLRYKETHSEELRSAALYVACDETPPHSVGVHGRVRQEAHYCGADRNVPAVKKKPTRVWSLLSHHGETPPKLPMEPIYGLNAQLHDYSHDWSMRGPGGCLRYGPGGGHSGEWLLCEWE